MASKDDIIADQAKQIEDLMKRIAELELQLAKASNAREAGSTESR